MRALHGLARGLCGDGCNFKGFLDRWFPPLSICMLILGLEGIKRKLVKVPSHNEGPQLSKNKCLARCEQRPMLVIQPETIDEDVSYLASHSLICKFMGLRVSLPSLESCAQHTWNSEDKIEVMFNGKQLLSC